MDEAKDHQITAHIRQGLPLGTETFRGSLGGSMLRSSFYAKNDAQTWTENELVRTQSPISGSMLLSRACRRQAVKDPCAGATLLFKGSTALVSTPVQVQLQNRSRTFYLTRDCDISLQILRNTTKVNKYTNEKVGTAGTSTGMNSSLRNFKEKQQSESMVSVQ